MIIFSQSGCLLPLLILINLFFGLAFFKFGTWLAIELILILLFLLNSLFMARKIFSQPRKNNKVIDVEGKVIEERQIERDCPRQS